MRDWNAICLFCEDVREEKQGDTLLGIFPDNVAVGAIPSGLPKFGVYVRLHVSVDAKIKTITLKLRLSDGEEIHFGGFEQGFIEKTLHEGKAIGLLYSGFIVRGVASPFGIKTPGRCHMIAKIDDEEVICGSVNFQVAIPDANVSQLPASQSPHAAPAKV